MASEEDVCARLSIVTSGLSTQFRVFATGILVFCGGLLVGNPQVAASLPVWLRQQLVWVALVVVFAFVCDLVQLLFGYWVAWRKYKEINAQIDELKKAARARSEACVEYDEHSMLYQVQMGFFFGKLAVLLIAASWLTIAMTSFLRQEPNLGNAPTQIKQYVDRPPV
jgi:hypothetical protein